jgi:thermitase
VQLAKYLTCLLVFSFVLQQLCTPSPLSADSYSFKLEGATLSVTAENVTLQTILQEFAAAGITVRIDPAINPLISANFHRRPLEQALESLLKSASYSLLWEAMTSAADNTSMQLAEIQVFQKGRKDQMQLLQPQRTEVISKNNQGVFFVQDEILLYLPQGTNRAPLEKLLRSYNATFVENRTVPGLIKVLLPENSDVFTIAAELKNKLNLEISQPNYAYPMQPPVHFTAETVVPDIAAGYYTPGDNNGAPVAVLDSGLADNAALHNFVLSSLDVTSPNMPITDTLGHGTQMAFIASGMVSPYGSAGESDAYTPIIAVRAFDNNGFTTDEKIMDAISFSLANNARVMSLSWGSETRSEIMEKVFAYAGAKGLIIVAAAGNEPTGRPVYPAAYPSVIGVGALGPHGAPWENSNFGSFVAFYAPGVASLPVGYKGDPGLYAGTSIAAAYAAHCIAGFLAENPAATQQEIQNYLQTTFNRQ